MGRYSSVLLFVAMTECAGKFSQRTPTNTASLKSRYLRQLHSRGSLIPLVGPIRRFDGLRRTGSFTREGLYHLKEGKLSRLVGVARRFDGDRVLRNIAFGSLSAARDGAIALTGTRGARDGGKGSAGESGGTILET